MTGGGYMTRCVSHVSDREDRWPPERRIALIRDQLPESVITAIFDVMIPEGGGEA